jgi:ATP/maltotriose-dependent transcriptional regulator MalT
MPSIARFLGLAEARAGRIAAARATLTTAMDAAATQGNLAFAVWCRASLAEVALRDGAAVEAATIALAARQEARRLGIRPVEAQAARIHGEAISRGEDHSDAAVRDALEDALMIGMRPEIVACRFALARHFDGVGDIAEAQSARDAGGSLAAALGLRVPASPPFRRRAA